MKSSIALSRIVIASSFLIIGTAPAVASSFTIVPTFDSTLTALPNYLAIESTINTAIGIYESDFTDPITVNITYASMTSGLGQTSFTDYPIYYKTFITALTADKTTAADTSAVAGLATCAGLTNSACMDPASTAAGATPTATIYLKSANAMALGLNVGNTGPDATVSVNFGITNVSRTETQNSSYYDLLSVVMHETDEALGLGSSLGLGPVINAPSPEDLFRYAADGTRSYTLTTSVQAYFSINGTTDLAQFNNTGSGDYGDWAGAGHTTPSSLETSALVQDATGTPGAQPNLSNAELTALDVIGYNRAASVSSPEPSTWLLLGSALLIGLAYQRSRA